MTDGRPALITGAAGFAGSHVLDLLVGNGRQVVAWHHQTAPPRQRPGVPWQRVNLLDRSAVSRAIEQIRPREVYHCAGAPHVGRSWETAEATLAINVLGTHHLVESLRAHAPDARVLIPSSALVYRQLGEPIAEDQPLGPASPYALSKLAQELVGAENSDNPVVCIARAFNHCGPRQAPVFAAAGFARQIAEIEAGLAPPSISVGNLEARRDLTDVRDTVRAYRSILEQGVPGRAYNVCTGRAVQIGALLDMLLTRARVPIEVVRDPSRYRPNDTPLVVGDASRIKNELGWEPQISLEQTLDDLLDFWRKAHLDRDTSRPP
jgi:GDP-4-dehydro-6-deoxy-D-mannose reductase